MSRTAILVASIVILFSIVFVASSANVDYSLGGSTKGRTSVLSTNDGFHGSHSAYLSVVADDNPNVKKRSERYARVYATPDETMPVEDLDQLSMWIKPISGNGKIKIDIYLDGDGDGKCDTTHSQKDVKLSTDKIAWSDLGMENGSWNEMDAFDLAYDTTTKDQNSKYKDTSLGEYRDLLKGMTVVKVWIRIYDGKNGMSAYVDYLKMGSFVISFEPLEEEETKKGPRSVSAGSKIKYTITYGNIFDEPIDLKVVENYDSRTLFLEASPAPDPGSDNVWTISQLPPGEYGQIKVTMVTSKPKIDAEISGEVSGEGYADVKRAFSTERDGYLVTNKVDIYSDKINISAQTTTTVKPAEGNSIAFNEHGSGQYRSSESLGFTSSRLFMEQEMRAVQGASTISLYKSPLKYNASWYATHMVKNDVKKNFLSEKYLTARRISYSGSAGLTTTKSWMEGSSNFSGLAQYGSVWRNSETYGMLAGDFTVSSDIWGSYQNKTRYPSKDWLGCCLEQDNESLIEYFTWSEEDDDYENETDDNETELVSVSPVETESEYAGENQTESEYAGENET